MQDYCRQAGENILSDVWVGWVLVKRLGAFFMITCRNRGSKKVTVSTVDTVLDTY